MTLPRFRKGLASYLLRLWVSTDSTEVDKSPTIRGREESSGATDLVYAEVDAPLYCAKGGSVYRAKRVEMFEEFLAQSGSSSLPNWLKGVTAGAGGSPVADFKDSADGGQFELSTDNTSEAQIAGLYGEDKLFVDITRNPIFEARVSIAPAGATFTADERVVIGLASARNATLDSIAVHAWFRVEGASNVLLVEGDDGTTDTDDQSAVVSFTKGSFHTYRIDASDLSAVAFYVDGALVGTVSIPLATGNLQPIIEHQRDAGTEENTILIDYVDISCDRV